MFTNTLKFGAYVSVSLLAAAAVLAFNMLRYPNYFSALHAVSNNVLLVAVFVNMIAAVMLSLYHVIVRLAFGKLRDNENSVTTDRFWTLIVQWASTIRYKIPQVYDAFPLGAIIVFLKLFHWVLRERVRYLFSAIDALRPRTQVYYFSLCLFVAVFDINLFALGWYALLNNSILARVAVVHYADILRSSLSSLGLYCINWYEAHRHLFTNINEHDLEEEWDLKPTAKFALHFVLDVAMLVFYGVFIYTTLELDNATLLLLCFTVSGAYSNTTQYLKARAAKKSLDKIAQPATANDLVRDNVCVICRLDMEIDATAPSQQPRKLNCSHIIHYGCLKSWISRSQDCPTCRQSVFTGKSTFSQESPQAQAQPAEAQAQPAEARPVMRGLNEAVQQARDRNQSQSTDDWIFLKSRTEHGRSQVQVGTEWYYYEIKY